MLQGQGLLTRPWERRHRTCLFHLPLGSQRHRTRGFS